MDTQGFREFLGQRSLSKDKISASIALAERFEEYLHDKIFPQRTKEAVDAFSKLLIEEGEDTLANLYALARYGRFIGNNQVYLGVVDLLDGAEAMNNLYRKAETILGTERRDIVFREVNLPSLGTPNREKVAITQKVMTRLVDVADLQECDQILSDSLRDLEDTWFQDEVKLFEECRSLDEFLDRNAQNFIAILEKIRDEGGLFFTQEISDAVIEYVRNEPLIARGVREGNTLYEVKIPHMAIEFLAATDAQMKRYFYCHCPWVKEALRDGNPNIPPTFCSCSAGFHKKRWEVIFGQKLRAEIVESVLNGDDWCKIAIHLPEQAIATHI
jgi:hypothetical protein